MNLGELRKHTAHLPDSTPVLQLIRPTESMPLADLFFCPEVGTQKRMVVLVPAGMKMSDEMIKDFHTGPQAVPTPESKL